MLILASQSPRRAELLSYFGIPFEITSADIDETRLAGESPIEMTERLSVEKANVVMQRGVDHPVRQCWVLGGDTTVALEDEIFGKPESRADVIATLQRLSGQTHQVISSVCLMSCDEYFVDTIISQVTFGELSKQWIEQYCDGDEPWDKAGSYGIQGQAGTFVAHINGDYSAIMGLPLWATGQLLAKAGLRDTKR